MKKFILHIAPILATLFAGHAAEAAEYSLVIDREKIDVGGREADTITLNGQYPGPLAEDDRGGGRRPARRAPAEQAHRQRAAGKELFGAGLPRIETEAELRYEITRKFAPYLDLVYERALGNTARMRRAEGGDPGDLTPRAGLAFRF